MKIATMIAVKELRYNIIVIIIIILRTAAVTPERSPNRPLHNIQRMATKREPVKNHEFFFI